MEIVVLDPRKQKLQEEKRKLFKLLGLSIFLLMLGMIIHPVVMIAGLVGSLFFTYEMSKIDNQIPGRTNQKTYSSKNASILKSPQRGDLYQSYNPGDEIETNIVGVSFENRQSILGKLNVNDDVLLEREPSNPHDTNAIKVLVYKYSKAEQEDIENERKNVIESQENQLRGQESELHKRKVQYIVQKESEEKINAIEQEREKIKLQRNKLHERSFGLIHKQFETVQAGYINKELAKYIAPYFDKWAVEPATLVRGKVIRKTGTEEQNLTRGAYIRFKLPDEEYYRAEVNLYMAMAYPPF